jgi:phosphatidylglycerophosphatase C
MDYTTTAEQKKTIAAFDFDGTITTRDTLPVFIRFSTAIKRMLFGTLQMVPSLALYKLKFISNNKAKEKLFKAFFAGIDIDKFNEVAGKFPARINDLLNPVAIEKIKWHQKMGHEVIIISASAENWIKPWATQQGINTILATQLEIVENKITGNFSGQNCHGAVKVDRLLKHYPDKENYTLYAYGDSSGDKELLALADHSFYRTFN